MVNRAAEDTLQEKPTFYQIISLHLKKSMKKDQELIVITKTYDLILWSCNHTSKFPRNHRFVLGERIERNLYNLLETLIAAKYTKNRQRLLEEANLSLEVLRFQMRLAKDLQCLKVESYAFAAKSIDEIGRLVGGWLRSRGEEKRVKRQGNLWDRMISFESLLLAAHAAARGKRFKPGVARFVFDLERQLLLLHEELASKTYRPGPYRTFTIYEGKTRQISAAPFRDRVVHHALTGVLEPIFERSFIFDSYACRKGKGTHAAVDRCQQFARRYRYVLKADVRKFFPSIDHQILKTLITRKIKDPDVLWLVGLIIDHSNPQDPVLMWFPGDDLFTPTERRRGLPLGNQTSQFFANVYLDPLDHFVCDRLGLSYVRYVDDFLVFADDKRRLHEVRVEVEHFLETLRLQIHQDKSVVFPCDQGIRFLGYPGLPDAPTSGPGKRPTVPSPDALDAARVCHGSDRVRRHPPPDHELAGSRPACRHLSPANRPVS